MKKHQVKQGENSPENVQGQYEQFTENLPGKQAHQKTKERD
ncbi:hypothetical protein [Metabacillus lacus]|nr:hypothetical protein [Metabacillus lacus]